MARSVEMNTVLDTLNHRSEIIGHLKTHRPQLLALFSNVLTQTDNAAAGKTHTFAPGVLEALPSRAKMHFMRDFCEWAERFSEEIIGGGAIELSHRVQVIPGVEQTTFVVYDRETTYHIQYTITFDDLVPYLRGGLDWHPDSRTFFVPRS